MAKIKGKEKILIICRYENWCVTWFKNLLNFLADNIYHEDREKIRVNRRNKCICIPEKEIIFVPESREFELTRGMAPNKVIHWYGDEVVDLWNQI